MPGLRSYGDPCGIARALDLIGERWALLLVRELLFGPKRFSELRAGLYGASPNVLAQRLRELTEGGVVRRSESTAGYELTEFGAALHPILVQLGQWGARSGPPPRGQLSRDALLVALEATFKADAAGALDASFELRLNGERYAALVERGQLTIQQGALAKPDAVIEGTPEALRAVVFGGQKLADAELQLTGDQKLGRTFLRLFERPALRG